MEERKMSTDIQYIAKQILNLFEENKVIAVSCATESELKVKNKNFAQIVSALKESKKDFLVINYDSTYKGDVDVDATSLIQGMSYALDKVEYDKEKPAIVNINPILSNKEMLDLNSDLNKVVLSFTYGKTTFKSLEELVEIVKDNGVEVVGVIANKTNNLI